jgi:hypothetical protein
MSPCMLPKMVLSARTGTKSKYHPDTSSKSCNKKNVWLSDVQLNGPQVHEAADTGGFAERNGGPDTNSSQF